MKTQKRNKRSRTIPALGAGFAATHGCPEHVHFEMTTQKGARATVLGDPNMPERTRNAIAVMLDAADAALKSGKLKAKDNAGAQRPEH